MGASLPSASDARPHPGDEPLARRRTLLVDHRLLVLGAVLVVLVGVNAAVEPGYLSAVACATPSSSPHRWRSSRPARPCAC